MKLTVSSSQIILPLIHNVVEVIKLKNIILSDLDTIIKYLENFAEYKINGKLEIILSSKVRREADGCVFTKSENICFDKSGVEIMHFYQEDYFGEYYTNLNPRLDEIEFENDLAKQILESLDFCNEIIFQDQGSIKIKNSRFYLIKSKDLL
jgi:hemerythrin-like domain-containing protein